jgi:hypothetical protein
MSKLHIAWSAALLLTLIPAESALADAIVRSNAMFASTIAEYFVEHDRIRVELEIGEADVASFRNLLPDEVYQDIGFGSEALPDRLNTFFSRDLAILAAGEPLPGKIAKIGLETRVLRDDITGEPLPSDDENAELVIAATLIYPLESQPDSLTLMAPRETGMASLGFLLYHRGVAVNDFRFLSSGATVALDWSDPWYSAFKSRSMNRQYYSPMTGFIYVEPFEVRKEIIVRPMDIQRWVDLGLEGVDSIPPERHDEVKAGIVDFLDAHFAVSIDGKAVVGSIDRVNFLQRSLKSSVVVDEQDIPVLSATVGVIYVFPTDGLPQFVEMKWDLFTDRMQRVPVAAVDQAGPLPMLLEPDFNILRWENFLRFPELPTLTDIKLPPTALQGLARWGQWLFAALALLALFMMVSSRLRKGRLPAAVLAAMLIAAGLSAWSYHTWQAFRMNPERLQLLVGDLLHNVYRAFDHRGEEVIYDVLEKSVKGELLADIYLETRRGLELANQGGAQVKVKDIEMIETRLLDRRSDGFLVESNWNVAGSVGHWGHVHKRTNGYHANIEVRDVDGAWKLTALEILQEERL